MPNDLQRQSFIDWLKAVGMLLIVIGHIVGSPYNLFNLLSQPVYTKQLGVCFFIFIMGWSLANEHRHTFKVVFNRVFPVYFYGILFALLISSIFIFTINDINESNYLPFFLGINVLLNHFPANPTTWYIGTYLHVLLFWFFCIRGRQITRSHLLIALVAEILIRAALLYINKDFIAYMLLPNWLTVFLLGTYLYQQKDTAWNSKAIALIVAWCALMALWASPVNTIINTESFPFRQLLGNEDWTQLVRSALISVIYLGNTYIFFQIFRRLPKSKIIEFFARNSLITFIIHMPLILTFHQDLYVYFDSEWSKKLSLIIVIFVGCAVISEIMQKWINVAYFQAKSWNIFSKFLLAVTPKKPS